MNDVRPSPAVHWRPDLGPREQAIRRGVVLVLAAVFIIAVMDVAVKYASREIPSLEISWGRFVGQALILAALAGPHRIAARMRSRVPGLHVLRAVVLLIGTTAFIAGLRYLPLAEANAIGFAGPLLLTALSRPVLGEPVGLARWLAVACGFVGIVVVMRPGSALFQWAALLPLTLAMCSAIYHVTTPLVARTEDPRITLYYVAIIGTIVLSLVMPFVWAPPSAMGWLLLAAIGALGTAGHFIMIRAFTLAPAATLSPLLYTYLIWALVFGWFVFGEWPDSFTLIGAALVVAGGVYVYRAR